MYGATNALTQLNDWLGSLVDMVQILYKLSSLTPKIELKVHFKIAGSSFQSQYFGTFSILLDRASRNLDDSTSDGSHSGWNCNG